MDDILVIGDDTNEILDLKKSLHEKFQIKDLGYINYFLGLKFNKVDSGMIVHQQKYIKELLKAYTIIDAVPVTTPLPPKLHLSHTMDDPLQDPTIYRQLIGKLNFLLHTRPDLAFSIEFLSQFNQTPSQSHYDAALHVLKYLKGSMTQGLHFNNSSTYNLEAYCDSDWASCPLTRRSVSGFFILLVILPFLGSQRNKLLFLYLQSRLNIVLCDECELN